MKPVDLTALESAPTSPLLDVSGLNKLGQMLEVLDANKAPVLDEIARNAWSEKTLFCGQLSCREWLEMLKGRIKFLNQGWHPGHKDNLRNVLRLVDEAYKQYRPEFYPVFGRMWKVK